MPSRGLDRIIIWWRSGRFARVQRGQGLRTDPRGDSQRDDRRGDPGRRREPEIFPSADGRKTFRVTRPRWTEAPGIHRGARTPRLATGKRLMPLPAVECPACTECSLAAWDLHPEFLRCPACGLGRRTEVPQPEGKGTYAAGAFRDRDGSRFGPTVERLERFFRRSRANGILRRIPGAGGGTRRRLRPRRDAAAVPGPGMEDGRGRGRSRHRRGDRPPDRVAATLGGAPGDRGPELRHPRVPGAGQQKPLFRPSAPRPLLHSAFYGADASAAGIPADRVVPFFHEILPFHHPPERFESPPGGAGSPVRIVTANSGGPHYTGDGNHGVVLPRPGRRSGCTGVRILGDCVVPRVGEYAPCLFPDLGTAPGVEWIPGAVPP